MLPLLAGTLVVTAVATLVCVPFGLGAAIYLSEYARPRVRAVVKPLLEVLVGIPTVVFGYFALTFVTPLLKDLGFQVEVFNALSAGLVMGVMLIPIVASLSEDAMTAVPNDLRAGGYAAGRQPVPGGHPDRRPAARCRGSWPRSCSPSRVASARR